MNYDLVLCGVGGQGVLSIAWVIDQAAAAAGFHLKQPEVHGMAQRGGAVSAQVRIADAPIASDLISEGSASMVLSVEPMEALRYTRLLRPDGWIVTDVAPVRNVASYPETGRLFDVLFAVPRLVAIDGATLAHRCGIAKAHNMVMLGAAAALLPMPTASLEQSVRALFAAKGPRVVAANVDAFRMGDAAGRFATALLDGGVARGVVARVVPRLEFEPRPVPDTLVAAWVERLRRPPAAAAAERMFAARGSHALEAGLAAVA